jgi:hypothetical protein
LPADANTLTEAAFLRYRAAALHYGGVVFTHCNFSAGGDPITFMPQYRQEQRGDAGGLTMWRATEVWTSPDECTPREHAPASVTENIETVIGIENEALTASLGQRTNYRCDRRVRRHDRVRRAPDIGVGRLDYCGRRGDPMDNSLRFVALPIVVVDHLSGSRLDYGVHPDKAESYGGSSRSPRPLDLQVNLLTERRATPINNTTIPPVLSSRGMPRSSTWWKSCTVAS